MSDSEKTGEAFTKLYAVLDEIAKEKMARGYTLKIQFLDKSRLEYSYKNPDFAKPVKR